MKGRETVHPFYPRELKLDGYVPNDKDVAELLGVFFGVVGVSVVLLWVVMAGRSHLRGRIVCKTKISWFFMCGLIHTILEGYFGVFHRTIPQDTNLLAQMWKEYGKGDSRYVSGDTFTVCMENITAFIDGPLAFLATYAFLRNTSYRYVVQLVLSLCQLYGDVLYMVIEWKDGFPHGPYGHPLYFWFYFVFLNTFWIIVPLACILESWYQLTTAHATVDRLIPISDNMYNVPDRINTSANHKNMKKQK